MEDQVLKMLTDELKEIKAGQEKIHTRIDETHTQIDIKITKGFFLVNGRMRKLEGWRNRIVGALSVLTVLGIAFVSWVFNYLPM